jgi:hypothetical protein
MTTMGFEGKWMQLEDVVLSEVSQDQKHKSCIFLSYVEGRSKDKHIHKTSMSIYKLIHRKFVIVKLLYGTQGRRERKRR